MVIVYCEFISAEGVVLVIRAVPLPVNVPLPLRTTAASGVNVTLEEIVNVPAILIS